MPNWIEGTLKLRGKTKDLRRFFKTAIQPCACFGKEPYKQEDFIEFDFHEDWAEVHIKEDAYIEGTQRAFINDECYAEFEDDEDTVCIPIRQAWAWKAKNDQQREAIKEFKRQDYALRQKSHLNRRKER